jgi:hypothetical protein
MLRRILRGLTDPHRFTSALGRRVRAARAMARLAIAREPFLAVGDLAQARVAVVSTVLPPERFGWPLMIEKLLGPIPAAELLCVAPAAHPWGQRPAAFLATREIAGLGSAAAMWWLDRMTELEATRAARRLARRAPGVRRVLATFDRYLLLGARLARALGAELWLYAIDDHTRDHPAAWRGEALARASRIYAISREMGERLVREHGVRAFHELPPLADVPPDPAPLPPDAPRRLVFLGNLEAYHERPFGWLARAADEVSVELTLVTSATRWERLAWRPPPPWRVVERPSRPVEDFVREAHAGVVLLTLDPEWGDSMTVAFPSKMREYLALGRPVVAVAPPASCTTRVLREHALGWAASSEVELREAVRQLDGMSPGDLAAHGARGHAFARAHLDAASVGRAWVEEFTAGR